MKRPHSEWSKQVKKVMIDRDMDMNDLAEAIGKSREWTSAVVNERVRSYPTAALISDALNVPNTAYSNW
ncbi:MAG: XRE family transcriptional regulator [Oscillospiraceae bacterium]|nr:XRE family transcriptional regulator [Oscillospiraceae bacterium]